MNLATKVSRLERYLNLLDQYNLLPSRHAEKLSQIGFVRAFAMTIVSGKRPQVAGYRFSTIKLRSLTGERADWLLAIDSKLRCRRGLTAFVGHRFVDNVTKNLRHNLQRAVQPYGIRLAYSDSDMPNGPVFQSIWSGSRPAHSVYSMIDKRKFDQTFLSSLALLSRSADRIFTSVSFLSDL